SLRQYDYDFAVRAYAHTIARFERRAAPVETRMQAPVYHQHRAGLRRQVRLGSLLEECPGLSDDRPISGNIEDAIRLHMKIAVARSGVYVHELALLFHIESHRLEGRGEHAGVGGESQPPCLVSETARQGGASRTGRPVRDTPL